MSEETLFSKIAQHKIPADIVYEDDEIVAFRDIHPQAPTHLLIVPREPIPTINDVEEKHTQVLGRMILVAKQLARQENVDQGGYRLIWNCNSNAGQEVFHLHMHLVGGRRLGPLC